MGKTQVTDKDRPDLEKLEGVVKAAGHQGIGTAALSEKTGIAPERIRSLFKNHFSQVERKTDTSSTGGIPADLWVYRPTPAEIAKPHEAKKGR